MLGTESVAAGAVAARAVAAGIAFVAQQAKMRGQRCRAGPGRAVQHAERSERVRAEWLVEHVVTAEWLSTSLLLDSSSPSSDPPFFGRPRASQRPRRATDAATFGQFDEQRAERRAAAAVAALAVGAADDARRSLTMGTVGAVCRTFMRGQGALTVHDEHHLRAGLARPLAWRCCRSRTTLQRSTTRTCSRRSPPSTLAAGRDALGRLRARRVLPPGLAAAALGRFGAGAAGARGGGVWQLELESVIAKLRGGGWVHYFPEGTTRQDGAPASFAAASAASSRRSASPPTCASSRFTTRGARCCSRRRRRRSRSSRGPTSARTSTSSLSPARPLAAGAARRAAV